jgi:hypothetical protein
MPVVPKQKNSCWLARKKKDSFGKYLLDKSRGRTNFFGWHKNSKCLISVFSLNGCLMTAQTFESQSLCQLCGEICQDGAKSWKLTCHVMTYSSRVGNLGCHYRLIILWPTLDSMPKLLKTTFWTHASLDAVLKSFGCHCWSWWWSERAWANVKIGLELFKQSLKNVSTVSSRKLRELRFLREINWMSNYFSVLCFIKVNWASFPSLVQTVLNFKFTIFQVGKGWVFFSNKRFNISLCSNFLIKCILCWACSFLLILIQVLIMIPL